MASPLNRDPGSAQPQYASRHASSAPFAARGQRGTARRYHIAAAALLALLAGWIYGPLAEGYFLSDDFVILSWTRYTGPLQLIGLFDPRTEWFYRPMLKVVYWALHALFGLNPVPFHLFTIGMHTVAAGLIYYYVVSCAWAHPAVALAASLLFFVNHRHVEPVASISAMGELIAVPALLGSLIAAHRFSTSPRPGALLATAALLALALSGRESPVVLPLLAVISLLLFAGRSPGRRVLLALGIVYAVVLAGYAALQMQVVDRGGQEAAVLERGGLRFRPLNAESVVLGVMDYANGLLPGGQHAAALPLEQLRPVAWAELAALLAAGMLMLLLKLRLPFFGLCWMVISPLPFVFFNAPTDRYFYMPTIGYSLVLAGLFGELAVRVARQLRRPAAVLLPAGLAAAAVVLLLPQLPALWEKEALWNQAGRLSGRVLADMRRQLPAPVPGQAIIFVGLPAELGDVPIFRNGLEEAVELTYSDDRTLRAGIIPCVDIQNAPPAPPDSVFQYEPPGLRLLAEPTMCR